jgi:hypothetical protein
MVLPTPSIFLMDVIVTNGVGCFNDGVDCLLDA